MLTRLVVPSLILGLALLCGSGCVPSNTIPKSEYNQKVRAAVHFGMSKQALVAVFPQAIGRGVRQYPAGTVEALEVNIETYMSVGDPNRDPATGMQHISKWFLFFNNQLIAYGRPNEWPEHPEDMLALRKQ
jgi:hypothetical protein